MLLGGVFSPIYLREVRHAGIFIMKVLGNLGKLGEILIATRRINILLPSL